MARGAGKAKGADLQSGRYLQVKSSASPRAVDRIIRRIEGIRFASRYRLLRIVSSASNFAPARESGSRAPRKRSRGEDAAGRRGRDKMERGFRDYAIFSQRLPR